MLFPAVGVGNVKVVEMLLQCEVIGKSTCAKQSKCGRAG
jgi:hypothetical protein